VSDNVRPLHSILNLDRSERILVVDDDRDIRDAMCDWLVDEGYASAAVANGQEALSYLRTHDRPCLILLDLMMPVMDGWEFRRLQLADPQLASIPVVAITAGGTVAEAVPVPQLLPKPIRLELLLEVLREYC
jgi:CheY-like chemotaxis protein